MKHHQNSSCWPALAASCAMALISGAPATTFAAPALFTCPTFIPEKSLQLIDTPAGWKSFVGAPLYLHAAVPMSSPPEMSGELIGDNVQRGKTGTVYTYRIDGHFPNGKWLACQYGESDQISLARPLPNNTNVCTFTYRKGRYVGQNDIKIDCR